MQKWIGFFQFIIKQTPTNKVFIVMLFVILGLSYINFDNAKNYRRELNDCHNRRDSDAADHKKEISQINAEFRQQSKELVQSYRDLSKETEQLKKQTR